MRVSPQQARQVAFIKHQISEAQCRARNEPLTASSSKIIWNARIQNADRFLAYLARIVPMSIEIISILLGSLSAAVAYVITKGWEHWYREQMRWRAPDTVEIRQMLDGSYLTDGVRQQLLEKYNLDAFYIDSGIRPLAYSDLAFLIEVLDRKDVQVSKKTLRLVYPRFLTFTGGGPAIQLKTSALFENGVLHFARCIWLAMYLLLFWTAWGPGIMQFATLAAGSIVLLVGLLIIEEFQLPYREGIALQKKLSAAEK